MHPHSSYHPLEGPQSYHHPTTVYPPSRRQSYQSSKPLQRPSSRVPSTSLFNQGLQTPPPDMTVGNVGPLLPSSYGQLQQFEPPVAVGCGAGGTVGGLPGPMSMFRNQGESAISQAYHDYRPRKDTSPPSRRNSLASGERQTGRRNSSSSGGASMTVPATINGSKANLAEFASQV